MNDGLQRRYDAHQLATASRTPQGFLRASGRITRTGVFEYRRADGSVVREYHPPAVVEAMLPKLRSAPVTDLHPPEWVNPRNKARYQKGYVTDTLRYDAKTGWVEGDVVVDDEAMIAAVEGGSRREMSLGYDVKARNTPGVTPADEPSGGGQPYDVLITEIVPNHDGVGPDNWARAGRGARLDGGDDAALLPRLDSAGHQIAPLERRRSTTMIRFDGREYDPASDADLKSLQRAFDEDAAKRAVLTKERDEAAARRDGLTDELKARTGERDELKARLDGIELDQVRDEAKVIAPKADLAKAKDPTEVRTMALAEVGVRCDGQGPDYVKARFDMTVDALRQHGGKRGLDEADRVRAGRTDGKAPAPPPQVGQRAQAAYDAQMERLRARHRATMASINKAALPVSEEV